MEAIAKNNFSKAEELFEVALGAKESDIKAKAYLTQVQLILEADDLVQQNKIEDAVQSLDKSIKVKEGSKVIASKSKDKYVGGSPMVSNQTSLNLSPFMEIYNIIVPQNNMLRQINELVDFSFIL